MGGGRGGGLEREYTYVVCDHGGTIRPKKSLCYGIAWKYCRMGEGALAPPLQTHTQISPPVQVVYVSNVKHYAKTTLQWAPSSSMCVTLGVQGHSVSTIL